ncbi:hypothetical protein TSA1_30390 [Bradyrhizobium nitroreducens]|uniref:Uncharacterized protein n=1 Tax=Bradyrhizobium nitroreducens TaxID=709803 RepID=A0A2M6UIZ3_9BRAD|nr:hypothetical protein TSA1_30390 [Bradyrhizobium nitroreducens]
MGTEYVFPRGYISSLAKYRGLFSVGLRIHHGIPTYPEFVVFWIALRWGRTKFASLQGRLEALGYAVIE